MSDLVLTDEQKRQRQLDLYLLAPNAIVEVLVEKGIPFEIGLMAMAKLLKKAEQVLGMKYEEVVMSMNTIEKQIAEVTSGRSDGSEPGPNAGEDDGSREPASGDGSIEPQSGASTQSPAGDNRPAQDGASAVTEAPAGDPVAHTEAAN